MDFNAVRVELWVLIITDCKIWPTLLLIMSPRVEIKQLWSAVKVYVQKNIYGRETLVTPLIPLSSSIPLPQFEQNRSLDRIKVPVTVSSDHSQKVWAPDTPSKNYNGIYINQVRQFRTICQR